MRLALFTTTIGMTMLLGGCTGFGKNLPGGTHPAANANHPRAEAVLARDRQAGPTPGSAAVSAPAAVRENDKESARDAMRDPAAMLREGIRLYNNGEFNAAIAKFNTPEIQGASAAIRLGALKYTAFSYCVTQRPAPCRQAFDRAFRIDPGFTLSAGEEGHPMWGPVFARAQASRPD